MARNRHQGKRLGTLDQTKQATSLMPVLSLATCLIGQHEPLRREVK